MQTLSISKPHTVPASMKNVHRYVIRTYIGAVFYNELPLTHHILIQCAYHVAFFAAGETCYISYIIQFVLHDSFENI